MVGFVSELSISLCSGAGGLDIGLEAAGWRTIVQIENNPDCAQTLAMRPTKNSIRPDVICESIEDVDPRELRLKLGLKAGELGLLSGGPPCQPFTTHGRRQAISDARAASVFPNYISFVREFRPSALVMENVDGMLSAAIRHRPLHLRTKFEPLAPEEMKGSFLKWLIWELVGLGYSVSWGISEAADCGAPQYRQRSFLIGVLDSEPCYLPALHAMQKPATLRDALRELKDIGPIQPLSAYKRSIYKLIPPGGNWRSLPIDLQQETMGAAFFATGGKGGWWRRLSWELPSPTILGMPDHSSTGLIHPDEVRCLGLYECAAIQTFPAGMAFAGKPRSQYQQVGNAVPPLLAEVVGSHVLRHLTGERSPRPNAPIWRKSSANRRIGTHGWALPSNSGPSVTLNAKVRDDHIWAFAGNLEERRVRKTA